mgnify:CR=1 FL=1
MRRYTRDKLIRGGQTRGTNQTIRLLRNAMRTGNIAVVPYKTKEGDRLDQLAAINLGSSKLWWVLATISGIGWCLQIPPGTRILIPRDLDQIKRFTG